MYNNKALKSYALVAQLDRVTGYEPVGQGFESLPARQRKDETFGFRLFGFYGKVQRDSNPERVSAVKKMIRQLGPAV